MTYKDRLTKWSGAAGLLSMALVLLMYAQVVIDEWPPYLALLCMLSYILLGSAAFDANARLREIDDMENGRDE